MNIEENKMTELVYKGREVEELCHTKWPDCVIEDASDFVHIDRFQIKINTSLKEFWRFAFEKGFLWMCLGFRIEINTPREKRHASSNLFIDELIAESKSRKEKHKNENSYPIPV